MDEQDTHKQVRYRLEVQERDGVWDLARSFDERLEREVAAADRRQYLAWWDSLPEKWKDRYGADAREFTRVVKIERYSKVTLTVLDGPGHA